MLGSRRGQYVPSLCPAGLRRGRASRLNTASAFNLRHGDASDLAGCATQTPGTVTPFPDPPFGDHTFSSTTIKAG